jgi:hypothetical protein
MVSSETDVLKLIKQKCQQTDFVSPSADDCSGCSAIGIASKVPTAIVFSGKLAMATGHAMLINLHYLNNINN